MRFPRIFGGQGRDLLQLVPAASVLVHPVGPLVAVLTNAIKCRCVSLEKPKIQILTCEDKPRNEVDESTTEKYSARLL